MIKYVKGDFFNKIKQIKDKSVNLFLIDPPWAMNYDRWDVKKNNFEKFHSLWIKAIIHKMTDDGTAWIFMGKDFLFANKNKKIKNGLINILEEYGNVNMDNWATWCRQKGRGSKHKLKSVREEIIHFTKSNKYIWNEVKMKREVIIPYVKEGRPRGWILDQSTGKRIRWTGLGNVWFYNSPFWKGLLDKQRHSAQKPFLLYERLILLSSNIGDLIVDPFAGSGASCIVSKYLKRNYIGIEKDVNIYNNNKLFIKNNYYKIIDEYNKYKKLAI